MAKSSEVAERYASALFALAGERGLYDAVAADLRTLGVMLDSSEDFRTLIYSPLITRDSQVVAVAELGKQAGLTDIVCNLLGLLATNRRLAALTEIFVLYKSKLAKERGEHSAEVTSATPLRPGQLESLREKITSRLGGRVTLNLKVDPEMIGGLTVKIGSLMIDSSIRGKLERMGYLMKGTV